MLLPSKSLPLYVFLLGNVFFLGVLLCCLLIDLFLLCPIGCLGLLG